ncbi:MAG: fatty acid--CoA ligase family protein, partial [Kangiellaceae bacterium]|nr:fatty acid--CoA ligase family protein [Kangiellaceae bacterium]
HGERLVVKTDSPLLAVSTMLVAWFKGVVVVPVKGGMSDSDVSIIAKDCNAKAIFQDEKITLLESHIELTSKFKYKSDPRVSGSDLALIIYTSGSTGIPKGIMLTHSSVVSSLHSISQYLRIDSNEHILGLSPLSFDYGLYQVLFSLYRDCQVTIYEGQFNPLKVVKFICKNKITLLPIVPAMASSIIKVVKIARNDMNSLVKLTNTGGHLSEAVIRSWKESFPQLSIFPMYGLTECKRALYLEPELLEKKMGSVGLPIPGIEAKLFQENKIGAQIIYREVEFGEVGELYVRGSGLMQQYCNVEAKGGARLIPGKYRDDNWLATGDLFIQDEEGFFFFKGRSKELIKQSGFCLYPKDIEDEVEKNSNINLVAVISGADKNGDEIAVLAIQLHQDNPDVRDDVLSWIKHKIDRDYLPREVYFFEEFELTVNSKIDKKHLARRLEEVRYA